MGPKTLRALENLNFEYRPFEYHDIRQKCELEFKFEHLVTVRAKSYFLLFKNYIWFKNSTVQTKNV